MSQLSNSQINRATSHKAFTPSEVAKLKTLWKNKGHSHGWSFICPLCRINRKVPLPPSPQPRHFVQVLITSAFFTVLTWNLFQWKGFVSFIPFWCIFEVIYRTRARATLYCKNCGFDPYLFLINSDLAKKEVEGHWRKKFEEKGIPYPEPKAKRIRQQPAPQL
jgi:hypothetical protein